MGPTDELLPILKKLRLSGVLDTLELRNQQAVEENSSYIEFLVRLLSDEVERRESKQLQLRLKRASFEHAKTLEDFDFTFNPQIPKARIIDLAACHFIPRYENALLVGHSGVGKSHVAQAIGYRACMLGYAVLYITSHRLFARLRAARADRTYDREMLRFTRPDLLVMDDLGLRPLRQDEPDDLYEIIRRRYERGAMIITSNRDVQEWYPLFGDALLGSSAMDRLLHHAHVIEMKGDSYRNPPHPRPPVAQSQRASSSE